MPNTPYQILITPRALRDLKKLEPKMVRRLDRTILDLGSYPYPSGVRKLIAKDVAQYRIRIGDYRILYDIDDSAKAVVILRVGHRREIYR